MVTKLIYSESPMYTMLDKDTIKNEILPHLSKAKRGYATQSCLIEVVNAILYKLKTVVNGSSFLWKPCLAARY